MAEGLNTAAQIAAPARAREVGAAAMRAMILVHRYLGVALGLLMTLWCLSGFVMMYQGFPNLDAAERLRGLAPLELGACCDLSKIGIADDDKITDARIEMLAGEPVLRLGRRPGPAAAYRLRTGEPVAELSPDQMQAVARDYAAGLHILGRPSTPQLIDKDQWTVGTANSTRPLYRLAFDDKAGSQIYINASSGQVVLDTNRKERILGWLGPVPHWLYFKPLRQNGPLWSQVVIWSSTAGIFLTVMGVWIGIARFKKRRSGRWSPYRGILWQHHVPGLVFGLLVLTWVFSGLLTMGPWGLLRSATGPTRQAFIGTTTWGEAKRLLQQAPVLARPGLVQIETSLIGGRLFALAHSDDGFRRYDVDGRPAGVTPNDVLHAAAATGSAVKSLTLLSSEDDYYYGQEKLATLPVYRVILADKDQTRIYVDFRSGKVMRMVDAQSRQHRWIVTSLHDLDFAWLRPRPLWDIVDLSLLAGVTFICGTGVWLGFRRIGHDVQQLDQSRRRRAKPGDPAGF